MNAKVFSISYGMDDSLKTTQLGHDAFHGRVQIREEAIAAKIYWPFKAGRFWILMFNEVLK